jgi:transitional endoplasmic reticulum ATPase
LYKTFLCFTCIILSPIVGLYNPEMMIKMHVKMGLAKDFGSISSLPPSPLSPFSNMDFTGMEQVMGIFNDEYLEILKNKCQAAGYNLQIPYGLMLYGPPGCGKTYTAKSLVHFAETKGVKLKFISLSAADIGSTYQWQTVKNIQEIFKQAKNQPTLVFIDECEALFGKRENIRGESATDQEEIRLVSEFLKQLQEARSSNTIIVGATNYIDKIDPAILRPGRFDLKIEIFLPDEQTRKKILFSQLQKVSEKDKTIDYASIAQSTDGYSIAEITYLVERVCRKAFNDKVKVSQKIFNGILCDLR